MKRTTVTALMLAVMVVMASEAGCGKDASAPAITCGPGTVLEGNMCIVDKRAAASTTPPPDAAPAPADAAPDTTLTGWQYETAHDKMREEDTRVAKLVSAPEVVDGAPTSVMMALSQGPKDKVPDVMFVAIGGQFNCGRNLCFIRARFDKQEVKPWPVGQAAFGASHVLIMSGTEKAKADWISALRSSSEAIVEFDFYNAGRPQFTFKVAGLVWDEAPKK